MEPTLNDLFTKMNNTWYYPQLFEWAYGDAQITGQRMRQSLAQFVRSIQSFDAKYDAGLAQTNNPNAPFPNFTPQENQGKNLFTQAPQFDANGIRVSGGAGCAGCHVPPEFDIRGNAGNNGVVGSFAGGTDFTNTKSPSLRDVVDASGNSYGGFMHDAGQNGLNTLLDVINHYDSIPTVNPNLDPVLRPAGNLQRLRLTTQEKNNIVAFVRTLTGTNVYTDARWSDPFTNDSLTIIPVSVQDLPKTISFKVYPTVTNGIVNIDFPTSAGNERMILIDLSGKLLYNGVIVNRLDMVNYSAGMYVLKFSTGQSVKIVKR